MKYFYFLLFTFCFSYAHPHTFIEVYPTIKVQKETIAQINIKWKMDEMTSSMLIMELDQNGNGKIDKEENDFIYENYFKSLKDYNFYTDIKIKDKTQVFPEVENFKATIEENKVCYSFDMKNRYKIKDTKFDFGDTDFFVAMILKKEFIKVIGSTAVITELDNDFYFGYRMELK